MFNDAQDVGRVHGKLPVEGTISYDGMSPEELRKHHKAEAAYLPEDDKVSIARSSDRRKRRRNAPRLRYRISLRSRT